MQLRSAVVFFAFSSLVSCQPARTGSPAVAATRIVYVGTFTQPYLPPEGEAPSRARGISTFRMDETNGRLSFVGETDVDNPSSLAVDASLENLYCVNENPNDDDIPLGRVTAFAIDPKTDALVRRNTEYTHGSWPTHLSVHPGGFVFAANYYEGDYPVFQLAPDGSLARRREAFVPSAGHGPDSDRQEGPHAHQILLDPKGRHVFGVDFGADRLLVWAFEASTAKLVLLQTVAVPPGSGPRHLAFDPSGRFAFLLEELSATVEVFAHDAEDGSLRAVERLSTLPAGFTGPKSTSEIRVHPNGRFLYTTNRGHGSIATFAIDPTTGHLSLLAHESTRGAWPRGMNIDPSGRFLLVANQNGDSLVSFAIDATTGLLRHVQTLTTPTPVDIAFGRQR